ncbi:MAG: sigma 54-interacting transcriptional regulator [Ignavibacteriaceae bacterium]|nr:sigma 54-interacting transcriptional regulator [Ignavibacteriaceae bacterium]
MNLAALIKNKTIARTAIVVCTSLVLVLFKDLFVPLNLYTEKFFSKIEGESAPDSNIVLIHISSSDLENIGSWPIKRSYYALLINKLTEHNVKAIGLEIFLSAKFISQTVYDNLLTNEIIKSDRVVLSSVAGNITPTNNFYTSDSLSYPSPKLLDEKIITGHINYVQDPTIKIPLAVKADDITEKAFTYQLAGTTSEGYPKEIDINFISSWKKFKNYSLLEFYDLIQTESEELKNLKDKIVIISVSDPQISQSLQTNFDDDAPAFTLHAFALDNLIHKRFFTDKFKFISTILFPLFFVLAIWLFRKSDSNKYLILVAVFVSLIILAFLLHSSFYLRLNYLAIILPFILLVVFQVYSELTEKKTELEEVLDEARVLKLHLAGKENELQTLKTQLEKVDRDKSEQLIQKIKSLEDEITKLKKSAEDDTVCDFSSANEIKNFYGIVYKSKVMQNVVDLIQKTAPEDANILIIGESGTGKELIARAVHALSKRNQNNFVAVNCGAISETLLESELFGHVKGSFTGALADKIGRFEAADNGTIFLDEIAETSENFQVKLLRVLQTGEFEKVGSSKTSKVNIRIVAATNKKLELAVKEKKFREDLYYRLNVIRIDLPPLRERKEDIEPIARYFLSNEAKDFKLSKAVVDALNNCKWSGNIRELESVIKRAVIFAKSAGRNMLQLSDLPNEIVKGFKLNFEDLVLESLRQKKFSHSSIVETAKELGDVSRTLVSENFRGLAFKSLIENNFDVEKTCKLLANTEDEEVCERAAAKLKTFLSNIQDSVVELKSENFEVVKSRLSSKYKNLPQKFHVYLDQVIEYFLQT